MGASKIINPATAGGGGTVTGSGTPGTLAKFATASSVGDSVVTESAGAVTITGSNALRGSRGGGGVANNFAAGNGALTVNTIGDYNTATGANALSSNTVGNYNTASGENALKNNILGNFNTASGSEALRDNLGNYNTAIGSYALPSNLEGWGNTAIGYDALSTNTEGDENTATGDRALSSNTIGNFNTATGALALTGNTTGVYNTATGVSALGSNTVGNYNTAVGFSTGDGITTGTGNTVLGAQVGGLAAGLTNNIILANGTGAIKAQHNGTSWAITNDVAVTGALSATSKISSSVSSGYAALFNGGNVGIGTASPAAPLHVNGNQVGGVGASVTPYAQALFGATSSYTMWWKTNATAGGGVIGSAGPGIEFYVVSGVPSAPTFFQAANFDSTGNFILGATTGVSIQAAGTNQGIKLPATPGNTDGQTLDCYLDGGTANSGGVAWTPALKFNGNTTGIVYTTQVGRYTRIGNMVFATCYVRLTSKGSATGSATIDGLPTSANLAGLYAAGTIGFISAITSTGTMQAYIVPNSSQITLRQVDIAGTNAATTDVNFANTSEIIISIAYSVN